MDYRLMKKGDDWKAYDVLIDGISLVRIIGAVYRDSPRIILRAFSPNAALKIAQFNIRQRVLNERHR